MQNTRIFTLRQISRYIYTDNVNYNISKQSKFINKLLNKSQPKRGSIEHIINVSDGGPQKNQLSIHTRRRMNVLNKVFMGHITDLMSTGEIEPEILNRNIEISYIKVTADFKLINVFWTDNSLEESDTEELLKRCAIELRHQLSQLRVIGNVPPIQFVKCRGGRMLKEVEQKLKTLSFGDDYECSAYPHTIHHTVTASGSSNNDEEHEDRKENNLGDVFSVSIPVMRQDVFGLDHYRIMSKIKVSLHKARKAREILKANTEMDATSTPNLDVPNVPSFLTDSEQQRQFTKFLSDRQKEQRRKNKKCSKADNMIHSFEEQNYDDNNDYDIENNYDEYSDEEHTDIDKCIEEDSKETR